MTPNAFAIIALLVWPPISLVLYMTRSATEATIWTILGAYLLLPVGTEIKFEMLPKLDKYSIASFCALVGCVAVSARTAVNKSKLGMPDLLVAAFIVGPVISSGLNADPIAIGPRVLPGVGWYDAISAAEAGLISAIPFIIGRRYLSSERDNLQLLLILVFAGLLYTLPMIFEMRFSPQLHNWIYGYFPTAFQQAMREAGYRPMVFMGHGLLASFFLMSSFVASAILWRAGLGGSLPIRIITPYLGVVLLLCRSAGATIYGIGLSYLVGRTQSKFQMRIAILLVCVAMSYPLFRAWNLFPTTFLVQSAQLVSDTRAKSLAYRFENEDALLRRASERWLFGWGRYGRSRVYDPVTGDDVVVTDGQWIQVLGDFGAFGFLSEFGLFALCVASAAAARGKCRSKREQILLAGLALLVAISVIDLLPNNSLRPWTWLLCGALLGRSERIRASSGYPAKLSWPKVAGHTNSAVVGGEVR